MALSRKHYEVIAEILHALDRDPGEPLALGGDAEYYDGLEEMRRDVANDLAEYFASENPYFDRERFLKAAGVKLLGIDSVVSVSKDFPFIEDTTPNYVVIFTYTDQHGINRRESNTYTGKDAYEKALDFMVEKIGSACSCAPIDSIWMEQVSVIHYIDDSTSYPVVD